MDFSKAVAEYKKLLAMKAAMELELPSFEKAVQNFKKSADTYMQHLNHYFHLHVCASIRRSFGVRRPFVTLQHFIPLVAPEASVSPWCSRT